MQWLIILVTGLLAGTVHVFCGPDHLAAVAPLAMDQPRRAWLAGLTWGVGHSSGVWVLAALALVFRESLPIESISAWSERLVGLVLIGIGCWGWRRAARWSIHTHVHEHDGSRHAHIHVHDPSGAHDPRVQSSHDHSHTHSALAIGTLHGLAGTSHLLGVLPALLLPTRWDAVGYVLGFGLGSIIGMMAFAAGIGSLAGRLNQVGPALYRRLMLVSSAVVAGVGVFWIFQGFEWI